MSDTDSITEIATKVLFISLSDECIRGKKTQLNVFLKAMGNSINFVGIIFRGIRLQVLFYFSYTDTEETAMFFTT